MLKSKMKRYIAMFLFVMMLFSLTTVYADSIKIEEDTTVNLGNSKIDPELQKVMDEATDEELIPVCLWLESIDDNLVDQLMIKENGMDPAVYEDEAKFNSRRLPQIEKAVEEELGYEKAHAVIASDEVMTDSNITLTDIVTNVQAGRTPIDEAVSDEYDKFVMAKRTIQKREQSVLNDTFVKSYVEKFAEREIIYKSRYSPIVILEATKSEIGYYVSLDDVKEIDLYIEAELVESVNVALEQTGVYVTGGTGYDALDWVAQYGHGVKIGIIESGRVYTDAPQLKGKTNLHFVDIPDEEGNYPTVLCNPHTTMVASIIAGKRKLFNSVSYAGVAPEATVYQTSMSDSADFFASIELLADYGVNVINFSAGFKEQGTEYVLYDKMLDQLLLGTGITFVMAAGNNVGYVLAPGKALCAITVGSVQTKGCNVSYDEDGKEIKATFELGSPYNVSQFSCYEEENYLPNKPDVVAPGENIVTLGTELDEDNVYIIENGSDVLYIRSGTSHSAPIVTGIIAQMMSENSRLKGNPLAVKAALILGSDHSKVNTTNDTQKGNSFMDKSGAGLVDARYALNRIITSTKINMDLNVSNQSERYYFEAGTRVKAVMVFNKKNDVLITDTNSMDNLDFQLKKESTGLNYAFSQSSYNNVEIIDTVINQSGYYYFNVNPYRIVDGEKKPDVAIAFRVFE